MRKTTFHCEHCGGLTVERKPGQRYCGKEFCQKARKNAWSRNKYATDPDYRSGQRDATEAWLESRGGAASYYREYRRRCAEQRRSQLAPKPTDVVEQNSSPQSAALPPTPPGHETSNDKPTGASPTSAADKTLRPIPSSSACPGQGANSDAYAGERGIFSGRYKIWPVAAAGGANKDAFVVDLVVISST